MFLSFCVFLYTLMHLHTHKYGRTLGMSFQLDAAKCSVRSPCYRSMNRDDSIGAGLYELVRVGVGGGGMVGGGGVPVVNI